MTFSLASQLHVYEVGAFSVIVKTDCETYGSSAALVAGWNVWRPLFITAFSPSASLSNQVLGFNFDTEHYSDHLECGQVLGGVSAGSAPGPG